MSTATPKPCTSCLAHGLLKGAHLCTLPPEVTGHTLSDDETWIGINCDTMRSKDGACGPAARFHSGYDQEQAAA